MVSTYATLPLFLPKIINIVKLKRAIQSSRGYLRLSSLAPADGDVARLSEVQV